MQQILQESMCKGIASTDESEIPKWREKALQNKDYLHWS